MYAVILFFHVAFLSCPFLGVHQQPSAALAHDLSVKLQALVAQQVGDPCHPSV